jgi:hypothetical protein
MEPEIDPDLEEIIEEIFGAQPKDGLIESTVEQQNEMSEKAEKEQEVDQISERTTPIQEQSYNFKIDNIGYQPKYIMTNVFRGDSIDTFYENPLNKNMVSNERIINLINDGTDDEIISLPNFICGIPGTKVKCDQAMECKFFTDVTLYLTIKYNIKSVADIYRRIALLSDRVCLGCKSTSTKVVCLSGKWRCHNCIKRGRDTDFITGIEEWLKNGSPSRHMQTILAQ